VWIMMSKIGAAAGATEVTGAAFITHLLKQ
jgi:hypothetical protein